MPYANLTWKRDEHCQVCEQSLPAGYDGYIGTGPGLHIAIVAWCAPDGTAHADGAVAHMHQGLVRRLTPNEALAVAAEACQALCPEPRDG